MAVVAVGMRRGGWALRPAPHCRRSSLCNAMVPILLRSFCCPALLSCREAGGVEALLSMLRAARQQQPAMRELPRDEEAAEAAEVALHALLVLLTGRQLLPPVWLRTAPLVFAQC